MRLRLVLLASAAVLSASSAVAAPPPSGAEDLSQVVVTAAPYAVSLDSVTTSVNVVTKEMLQTAPPVGLGDLLNGMPGLRSSFFGPGASRPIIRGLSGPRVLILQNGVGLVDASTLSPDHAVASDPGQAERIEVLRGPSTLAYGGSGIGGVVNIVDDRVPSRAPQDGFAGHASTSYDTVNDGKAGSVDIQAGKGPWVAALDATKRKSGDYKVPANPVSDRLAQAQDLHVDHVRRVLNSDVELDAYGAGLSYVGDDGFIGVSVKKTDTTYGVPFMQAHSHEEEEEGEGHSHEGPVSIHLQQTRYDLRGEKAVDLGPFSKLRLSVGHADYEHAEIEVESGEVGTRFLSKGTEGRLELVQADRDGWQGAVGVQGLSRDFDAIGDEAFVPATTAKEIGVFTLQRYDTGTWGVEGGLRLDRRTLEAALAGREASDAAADLGVDWAAADAKRSFTNVSASLAAFWRPKQGQFYAVSVSRNGRAPTEQEVFADGPHAGTAAFEIGGPALKSEKVVSVEATARFTSDRGRLEAHAYAARYDGFIDEQRTAAVEDGLPVYRFIQGDADFYGAEVEGSYKLTPHLTLDGAYDYVHGDVNDGPAARIPPWSLTGGAEWRQGRLSARAELRRVGGQDRVTAYELPTDAYTLVNARVTYAPFKARDFKLFIDARNLTDQEAREHASFLKDIAPLPGRSFRFGMAMGF